MAQLQVCRRRKKVPKISEWHKIKICIFMWLIQIMTLMDMMITFPGVLIMIFANMLHAMTSHFPPAAAISVAFTIRLLWYYGGPSYFDDLEEMVDCTDHDKTPREARKTPEKWMDNTSQHLTSLFLMMAWFDSKILFVQFAIKFIAFFIVDAYLELLDTLPKNVRMGILIQDDDDPPSYEEAQRAESPPPAYSTLQIQNS